MFERFPGPRGHLRSTVARFHHVRENIHQRAIVRNFSFAFKFGRILRQLAFAYCARLTGDEHPVFGRDDAAFGANKLGTTRFDVERVEFFLFRPKHEIVHACVKRLAPCPAEGRLVATAAPEKPDHHVQAESVVASAAVVVSHRGEDSRQDDQIYDEVNDEYGKDDTLGYELENAQYKGFVALPPRTVISPDHASVERIIEFARLADAHGAFVRDHEGVEEGLGFLKSKSRFGHDIAYGDRTAASNDGLTNALQLRDIFTAFCC